MTLISMQKLLAEAEKGGYALGYFEAWNLESLEAVMDAAEEVRSPVILGSGTNKDILVAGKMAMKRKVKELLELYGSVGKADWPR